MNTKSALGLNAGIVAALVFAGTYFGGVLFLGVALGFIALKETNDLVKDAAKKATIIYLIAKACEILVDVIEKCVGLFVKDTQSYIYVNGMDIPTSYGTFTNVMGKIDSIIALAYLVVMVVFAIIALVNGLPKAAKPANQNRTCPGCNTLLAGPGICPNCGTKVD